MEKRKTSVNGRDYVLHLRLHHGATTRCGRVAKLVNCSASDDPEEMICRICWRHRERDRAK